MRTKNTIALFVLGALIAGCGGSSGGDDGNNDNICSEVNIQYPRNTVGYYGPAVVWGDSSVAGSWRSYSSTSDGVVVDTDTYKEWSFDQNGSAVCDGQETIWGVLDSCGIMLGCFGNGTPAFEYVGGAASVDGSPLCRQAKFSQFDENGTKMTEDAVICRRP
jgi:hypothetical protein